MRRKRDVKRGSVIILTIAMSLAMLTGCGSGTNKSGSEAASPTAETSNNATATPGTADKEPTTVVTETPSPTEGTDPSGTVDVTETPTKVPEKPLTKDEYKKISVEYKTKDLEYSIDMTDITKIDFTENEVTSSGKKDVRITDVNGRKTVTITQKGKYLISGTCSNGQIIVNADSDKDIRLCLNGLNLTCPDSAAIYERQCDKLLITLVGDTVNTLSGTKDFIYDDEEKKNPDACIFAKDDLVINGNGTLNINSAKSEGIHSTDSIKLISGTVNVESGDRGIRGKQFIVVKGATVNVKCDKDALRTTQEDEPENGYIVIEGGSIKIETGSEGIQATGDIQITGGSVDISASGKKSNAMKSDKSIFIENATVTVNSEDSLKANRGVIADEGTVIVKQ